MFTLGCHISPGGDTPVTLPVTPSKAAMINHLMMAFVGPATGENNFFGKMDQKNTVTPAIKDVFMFIYIFHNLIVYS